MYGAESPQLNALSYAKARATMASLGDGTPGVYYPPGGTFDARGNYVFPSGDWIDAAGVRWQVQPDGSAYSTGVLPEDVTDAATVTAANQTNPLVQAYLITYGNQYADPVNYAAFVTNADGTVSDPVTGATYSKAMADALAKAQAVILQGPSTAYSTAGQNAILDAFAKVNSTFAAAARGDQAAAQKIVDDFNAQQAAAAASAGPSTFLVDGVEVYADGTPVPGGYNAADDAAAQIAAQGGGVNPVNGAYVPPAPGSVPSGGTVALDPTVVTDPSMPNGSPVAVVPAPGTVTTPGSVITDPALPPVAVAPSGPSVISGAGFLTSALQQPLVLVGLAGVAYFVFARKRR